jgi:hypothetical protein
MHASQDDGSDSTVPEDGLTEDELKARRERKAVAKTERRRAAKVMDLQYFLEMVDHKHRHGARLREYHEEWERADTNENFFYWLDHGEGKHLDLPGAPRERLESQRVRYLSREERLKYLVTIDKEGRLCWARNGEHVHTSAEYVDSSDGIVRREDAPPLSPSQSRIPSASSSTSISTDSDSDSSMLSSGSSMAKNDEYPNPPPNPKKLIPFIFVSPATKL